MPVISELWEAEVGGSLEVRSGVRDQPSHYGENPALQNIQKLAGHGSACLQSQLHRRLRITGTQEVEVAVSRARDHATVLQPG